MNSREVILEAIRKKCADEKSLRELKVRAAGKSGILMPNSKLVAAYLKLLKSKKIKPVPFLEKILKKSRIRTLSGVSPIAVLTKPLGCPGKCVFCPTEARMPKSYLSNEPAVMRAARAKFDPFRQVRDRLRALENCGHEVSKIELIVMGGTFSAHPRNYQNWFIRRCFAALNSRRARSDSLNDLKKANGVSRHRVVGLTLETRPDFISEKEIERFLKLGCTRVEIGVQNLDDKILAKSKRGHGVAESIRAIKLLKNAGLKVGIHLMPNLPLATPQSDFEMFREVFENTDFRPDQIKIYPTVLVENTELKKFWRSGEWQPYSDTALSNLLVKIKSITPSWVRLTRVVRDIPAESILAGNRITNLRQILQQRGVRCECIRCREIRGEDFDAKQVELFQKEYEASGGLEIFLSFEARGKLISLLRLRLPKK
ncbi:tRNA uridine(34) 5-carboxymethylaminomethyl modification radical SAM/GNAT enzyme Elp3, partial [Candidatus Gracilibacteria bacterium]|nr:tRNA uridine(34) 5-carboxymethylaminomethyl modification radical SAM/GNAT enzyme Elp3 [Candidatus Gracilibacteria bacterium]